MTEGGDFGGGWLVGGVKQNFIMVYDTAKLNVLAYLEGMEFSIL